MWSGRLPILVLLALRSHEGGRLFFHRYHDIMHDNMDGSTTGRIASVPR
jgi:hypothetical protein